MTDGRRLAFTCALLLYVADAAVLNCSSPTPEGLVDALERSLFTKKLIRPVERFTDTVNVTVGITVVGILGVNEKEQTLTTFLWQLLEWKIAGLSWDTDECGTERISVPREKLWIPDVQIAEFMEEDKSKKTPYVYLNNTGDVFDDKPLTVVSTCRLNIYTFPFDIQNCTLTFEPYLHFASDIRMVQGASAEAIVEESKDVIETHGEWQLLTVQVVPSTLVLEDGIYSSVKYHLIIKRSPLLYVVNLLIPSCFLSSLDLFSFLLPPQSVDRGAFKMTLILGYTVFLLLMNDLLPETGETTPLINVLFSVSLALMVASLLETVFITNIQFSSSQYSEVPEWLSTLVLRYMAVLVCVPPKKNINRFTVSMHAPSHAFDNNLTTAKVLSTVSGEMQNVKPTQDVSLHELRKISVNLMAIRLQMDQHFQGSKTSQEWHTIGIIIDRLLFGIYVIFMTVTAITILAIWVASSTFSP
ncbi:5-hydroxytryptamine receptor 3A-like [Neosynchiropus ocellatus]